MIKNLKGFLKSLNKTLKKYKGTGKYDKSIFSKFSIHNKKKTVEKHYDEIRKDLNISIPILIMFFRFSSLEVTSNISFNVQRLSGTFTIFFDFL